VPSSWGVDRLLALLEVSDANHNDQSGSIQEGVGAVALTWLVPPQDIWVVAVHEPAALDATAAVAASAGASEPDEAQWARTFRTRHPEAVLSLLLDPSAVLSAPGNSGGGSGGSFGGGRVSYRDVAATARAPPDFIAVRGALQPTAEAGLAGALLARLKSHGFALWLESPPQKNLGNDSSWGSGDGSYSLDGSVLGGAAAGTLDYRRRAVLAPMPRLSHHSEGNRKGNHGAILEANPEASLEDGDAVELTLCRGRVAAYAGGFLVGTKLFLAADYGSSKYMLLPKRNGPAAGQAAHVSGHLGSGHSGGRGGGGLGLRMLEGATFRMLAALESAGAPGRANRGSSGVASNGGLSGGGGVAVKTSNPLEFYVNHFSGWAHWHRRQTVAHIGAASQESTAAGADPAVQAVAGSGAGLTGLSTAAGSSAAAANSSGARRPGLGLHRQRSKELSRLMDLECRGLATAAGSTVRGALALVPFWGGSAEGSGGNAHFTATDRGAALQVLH
jgi:hypothetical protein